MQPKWVLPLGIWPWTFDGKDLDNNSVQFVSLSILSYCRFISYCWRLPTWWLNSVNNLWELGLRPVTLLIRMLHSMRYNIRTFSWWVNRLERLPFPILNELHILTLITFHSIYPHFRHLFYIYQSRQVTLSMLILIFTLMQAEEVFSSLVIKVLAQKMNNLLLLLFLDWWHCTLLILILTNVNFL